MRNFWRWMKIPYASRPIPVSRKEQLIMAKAKPLTGLDPHAPTGQNARCIARTRLEEMYSWAADVDAPYEVRGLHNLRIAAKRLRYTLEIFEDVLPPACQSI